MGCINTSNVNLYRGHGGRACLSTASLNILKFSGAGSNPAWDGQILFRGRPMK